MLCGQREREKWIVLRFSRPDAVKAQGFGSACVSGHIV
jgi:hypothetical protein